LSVHAGHRFTAAFLLTLLVAGGVQAQTPAPGSAAESLKVWIACAPCDVAALRAALPFAELTTDREAADVHVELADPAPGVRRWTFRLIGRGRFAGQERALDVGFDAGVAPPAADLARALRLGLAEYAAATPNGRYLDVAFTRPGAGADDSTAAKDQRDPWNYWVYRVSASADTYGEESQENGSYYLSSSATRVTEAWKLRLSGSRSLSRSRFEVDETLTVISRLSDWNVTGLAVKSLGPNWSAALTGSVVGSSFSNARRIARLAPGVEYDIFPYRESSRRSLTLQYTVGGAHYVYEAETIFGKLREAIALHTFTTSLGLRQPWGSAGGSFVFTQQLSAPERTRVTANGNVSVRVFRSLSVNASASYSRIRDLFTLEKGDATVEEVLLRQRQLATGYRYSMNVGFSYSFGSLSNTTVNPRFGG
jgi:hypothetical protein